MTDDINNKLVSLLFSVKRAIMYKLKSRKGLDLLSFLHAETLRFIEETDNPTNSKLAKHLCISKPSATSLLDNLERQKLIRRLAAPVDKRKKIIDVTTNGTGLIKSNTIQINKAAKEIFNNLNVT
mgnify:CR=1 FL=1